MILPVGLTMGLKTTRIMRIFVIVVAVFIHFQAIAQKYISESATITFFSKAPIENITATNKKVSSILDLSTGEIVFSVPIREFEFRKSLMKKHFNENYMESESYPRSTFKGKVQGIGSSDGSYQAIAVGELNIHGVTQKIEITGEVVLKPHEINLKAKFPVLLKDHNIKIPKILFSNIAEEVEVSIEFIYRPYASN